jgi:hypothetical protein
VDRLVLETVASRTYELNGDFHLLREGVCRLGLTLAAEIGRLTLERLRPEAERVALEVREMLPENPTPTRGGLSPRKRPEKAGSACI